MDYDKIGKIEIAEFRDFRGGIERREYKWIGPPETLVSWRLLDEWEITTGNPWAEIINIGPYRLKLIENSYTGYYNRYIRMDYPFWRVHVFWHRANRLIDLFYRRLIITLAVWKLAHYNPAVIPSWRDIKRPCK